MTLDRRIEELSGQLSECMRLELDRDRDLENWKRGQFQPLTTVSIAESKSTKENNKFLGMMEEYTKTLRTNVKKQ